MSATSSTGSEPTITVDFPISLAESLWHELQERAENLIEYLESLEGEGGTAEAIGIAKAELLTYQAGADHLHDALEDFAGEDAGDVFDTVEVIRHDGPVRLEIAIEVVA